VEKSARNYLNRLAEYGATPVILSPDQPTTLPTGEIFFPDEAGRLPDIVLKHLDGVIFSGGGDVHPSRFGQPMAGADPESIDCLRDELEIHLGRAALENDLPIFAICRGCQVLNVAAGGSMVQQLDGHRSPLDNPFLHPVRVAPDSRFRVIVGQDVLPVNTYHHQGLDEKTLSPQFVAAALDVESGWLIEAYESRRHRWVMGVQWHPERIFELPEAHRRLWENFIEACRP
jgi:putative glutamine amidotransferase